MKDEEKTKEQLISELMLLRQRIAEFERTESERKRAEEELRSSQERLNLALKSSKAGTWDRDIAADKATWDEHLHALFGLVPGTFSGKLEDFLGLVHPDDRERVKGEMIAAIDGGADYDTTFRVIWPDSSVHFIADRGKVYHDGAGRAVRMIGVDLDITELKEAEDALRESQQQLADIINFLPDATFVINKEGKVIAWNRAIEEMTRIKAADILGRGNYEYALPFHGERRPILIDFVLQPQKKAETSYEIIERKDSVLADEAYMPALRGDEAYLYGTASILHDSKGNVVGAIESIRDITERKRAEEELGKYRDHLEELVRERTATLAKLNEQLTRESEVRKEAEQARQEWQQVLQSVLDTIPVRVFWKNLDSIYLGCNRSFAFDAGLQSPEEIIGKIDFEMSWAEQAELYRADDRLVITTGIPKLGYEEPLTTPEGDRMWLRTNKVPLLNAEGRIKGVLGTYEDISESKRMEDALRASEAKYRIVADNTYDWEYWVNPEGFFLYTSPACQRITGYAASEFETDPKLLSRIVHPDDLTRFESHIEQDLAKKTPCGLEFRITHRDGTMRWIGHLCQPVFDAEGRFLGRRGSNRDITNRKQAEKALHDSSKKLKLFAYSVAHDLKSPAIGIYGLSKRMCKNYRDVLDEKGRNYCDQILRTSEHIAAMVDKINVYIATKEARLSVETINIAEILHMLKEEFSAQLSIRQIDWLKPETTLEIKADRLCMLRAFRNFVDNSLKYGGERLSKIWTGYEESEDFHIFSFGDNGKGLKEGDSEKIFGAFQRNETSRGVEGAGLGLTIAKEIAEQHGGKVWVEPRSKKGITFYISISKNL
jgi:PAS domain S-box-containing protein